MKGGQLFSLSKHCYTTAKVFSHVNAARVCVRVCVGACGCAVSVQILTILGAGVLTYHKSLNMYYAHINIQIEKDQLQ